MEKITGERIRQKEAVAIYDAAEASDWAAGGPEDVDFVDILKNSCMSCKLAFGGDSVRISPSKSVQEQDYYVRKGLVSARFMCTKCYSRQEGNTSARHATEAGRRTLLMDKIVKELLSNTKA